MRGAEATAPPEILYHQRLGEDVNARAVLPVGTRVDTALAYLWEPGRAGRLRNFRRLW